MPLGPRGGQIFAPIGACGSCHGCRLAALGKPEPVDRLIENTTPEGWAKGWKRSHGELHEEFLAEFDFMRPKKPYQFFLEILFPVMLFLVRDVAFRFRHL